MKAIHRCLLLFLSLSSSLALAQDDDLARLGAWEAAGQPGDAHAVLAEQAGNWQAEIEMWMAADAPPETTRYRVARTLELDGRVLHEVWTGRFMDQPFEGIGRTGYDNLGKRYWSTWTDNMSTGLMVSHGVRRDDGTIEMTGSFVDPLDGKDVSTRFVWTFPGPDRERMEAFETRDGEEFMNMRMTLTRTPD